MKVTEDLFTLGLISDGTFATGMTSDMAEKIIMGLGVDYKREIYTKDEEDWAIAILRMSVYGRRLLRRHGHKV